MWVMVLQGFSREGLTAVPIVIAGQWSPAYLNEV